MGEMKKKTCMSKPSLSFEIPVPKVVANTCWFDYPVS
jgi:hypothetical protein